MYQALHDLYHRLRGCLTITMIPLNELLLSFPITGVVISEDYTSFARHRNEQYRTWCNEYNVPFHEVANHTLFPLREYVSQSGTPYQVFAPFYRTVQSKMAAMTWIPRYDDYSLLTTLPIANEDIPRDDEPMIGTRDHGLAILSSLTNHVNYGTDRNQLTSDGTGLAPYHKFGLISIRETANAIITHLGFDHELLRQLLWHDYYYAAPLPVASLPVASLPVWTNDPDRFNRWSTGTTGYPLIDAGMRQLNQTGMIHNRARMLVANFLTSVLDVDWRYGEQYFATHLIDYDPLINHHSWRDVNNCGLARHRPSSLTYRNGYYRLVYNLKSQATKYNGIGYIRQWIPELATVPDRDVLNWDHSRYLRYQQYYDPLPTI